MRKGLINFACLILLGLTTGCNARFQPVETASLVPSPGASATPVFPTPVPSATGTPTITPTLTPTNTLTPTATSTSTATPIPTYVVLRGEVTIAHAVCHYGPGAPYLYKYGVVAGSHLEIIRRVLLGNYIEVQAIGGNNPCWLREDYMDVVGDLQDVQPVDAQDVKLPQSPYYGPPANVHAEREGNQVMVSWNALILRAGDNSEQYPYLIEAWVCQNGAMAFTPLGTYQTSLTVEDDPGCEEQSRANLVAAEKHGYTQRVKIEWPPAVAAP